MDTPLYLSEPFTRMQAWIDLLLLANHKEGFFYVRGNKVVVGRGQIGTSSRTLANRWQWSRGKVERFLQDLEESGQIKPQKTNVITLISICNYDEYQNTEPQNEPQTSHRQTTNEPQTDPNKNDNNVNNTNNDNKESKGKTSRFTPPTLQEVEDYIKEKGYSVDAEAFIAFYDSNGWLVGKNKMKSWKSAVTTWAKREAKQPQQSIRRNTVGRNPNKEWNTTRDGIKHCNNEWE